MQDPLAGDLLWWITGVEIPVLGGLFWLIWRTRRDLETRLDTNHQDTDDELLNLRSNLAAYKLEVAKSYASISYLKEVERRLTDHLVRIETKLDERRSHP